MLKTLMGDHAVTRQFKARTDKFDFIEVKGSAAPFFKRVVRAHEFDVAEMAIMTYVIAKSFGTPYRLLPFAVLARFQHPFLVYNAARGTVTPKDLHGKRVDIDKVRWVTFEAAHVAEFRDPPNVERAPAGKEIGAMLLAGELDAAIM